MPQSPTVQWILSNLGTFLVKIDPHHWVTGMGPSLGNCYIIDETMLVIWDRGIGTFSVQVSISTLISSIKIVEIC